MSDRRFYVEPRPAAWRGCYFAVCDAEVRYANKEIEAHTGENADLEACKRAKELNEVAGQPLGKED